MRQGKSIINNEKGVVLVISMFMLALLTMTGIASMMTSTIDIDIAANEKFHRLAFFQAESGLTVAAEVVERLGGYDSVETGTFFDDNDTIMISDGEFLFEPKDVRISTGEWDKDNQTDVICIDRHPQDGDCDDAGKAYDSNTPDIQLSGSFDVDLDVDKIGVRHIAGGGAEFGSGAEGTGVSTVRVIYNIDCIGRLPQNAAIYTDHIWGFQFIPRN